MGIERLEKPLPKPTTEDYINARLLEALTEAYLAVRFLNDGLVRDAAGKAFQAWRALLASLLRLELDKLLQVVKTEEEKKWLVSKAIPRIPSSKMKALSQMLEEIGHSGVLAWTTVALGLHDYQYNGPNPDMALSKYRNREEAAIDIRYLINELIKRVEGLRTRVRWSSELEDALNGLKKATGLA